MIKQLAFLFSLAFFVACDEELDSQRTFVDPNPFDVELRINNKSNFQLDSFNITTGNKSVYYGSLERKKTSISKSFQSAYEEMDLNFMVEELIFIHIAPTTSTKLENGQYELQIDGVDTSTLKFTFLLEKLD